MVKSSKSQHLEEDDEAYEELVNRNNSSSCRDEMMKVEGKSSEQKANTHRSKHSETEQRRRSKINERFQILRDIIPQNDQKRDKASFLLEVIEYIQFLQEKLQLYEGSYQGWSQELTKLTPWRSHNGPADSHMDHSQVLRNGSSHDNSVVTPSMLTNAQDSMESNFGTAALYKAMDLPPGSAAPMVSPSMVSPIPHAQSNMFAPLVKDGLSFQTLQDSVSDAENMGYQPQSQLWQGKQSTAECSAPNSALNEQEFAVENGSSTSNAYSQGVLSTLTQMLQSSGVDLSQTSISVQIDVGKQLSSGETAMASSSKDNEKQYQNNQGISQAGARSRNEDSEHPHKRIRTEQI